MVRLHGHVGFLYLLTAVYRAERPRMRARCPLNHLSTVIILRSNPSSDFKVIQQYVTISFTQNTAGQQGGTTFNYGRRRYNYNPLSNTNILYRNLSIIHCN
jgi:hypothetical protein